MNGDRRLAILLVVPTIALLLFIVIFPMIYSIYISATSFNFVHRELTKFVYADNFVRAFTDMRFLSSLRNTAVLVGVAVTVEFLLGLAIALLFLEPFKGKTIALPLLLLPMMITPVTVGYMFRLIYEVRTSPINYLIGLLGFNRNIEWTTSSSTAMLSILLVDIWEWTPFMMMVLLAGIVALPREPIEAAEVDGASGWQRMRWVTFPMLKPIVAIALLIRTLDAFKIFDSIFVVTFGGPGSATETGSFYAYLVGFRYFQMGYGSALSYILLIIITIVTTLIARRLFE